MSSGISANPLNPISQIYLDKIAEGRLKQLEKASALSASDNPADQDKAREIRVRHDYESLKKQIGSKKRPTRAAVKEETVGEGVTAKYKGKQYKLLPGKVREKMSGKGGLDGDYRDEIGKAKDWVTDKLKLTNTKRDGVKCPAGHQDCGEGFSDWRKDLREIVTDASAEEDIADEPTIKEKKVKNKIKINPTFKESAQEVAENLGGQLLHVEEVDDAETDERRAEREKQKEQMMKKRIIRMKLRAVNSGDSDGIVAGYEPDIDGAVEYFYEEGINEDGLQQLIEDIGLVDFIDFIDDGTAVELNEERAARKASVRAKKYDVVKKEVDKADAARRKAKKGEYAPSYAKKETDVTVYDDKPSAKKKTPVKKAPAKKVAKKDYDGDGKKEAPKAEHRGVRNKKITQAVAKVKKTQPAKKPSKEGLGDKIRSAYKAGVKRHRKATQGARVFGKGFAAGAKKAVKFAKDVKKVVSEEELNERLGGKGYKPRKDYAGRRVSGDWEDSDRGAGNKATRRAGGKVKKKSPTYQAYVLNKEEVQLEDRNAFKKAMSKVFKKKQEEKKPQKAMDAGARAKRLLQRREYASKVSGSTENVPDDIRDHYEVSEARVDKGRSDYGKASIRNYRRSGPGHGEPAFFDPENKRGKLIDKRREEHKARRGVKGAKVPAYKVEGYQRDPEQSKKDRTHSKQPDPSKDGFTGIGNMSIKDIMKMNARMKKEKKQKVSESKDKAFDYVVAKLRKQHGKDAVITKDSPKPKPPSAAQKAKAAAERKKRQDADNKAYAARAKKAGFKSTQDYTDVVARYGSEDNYRKGKGLGT